MDGIQWHGIEDVGVRLPHEMDEATAAPFAEYVVTKAAALRAEALALASPEVFSGQNPWVRLKFMLEIMKVGIQPQAERTIAEFAQAGAKIECRDGCSYCCYQNVDVTIPEAILVALRLDKAEDPRRVAVVTTADALAGLDIEARIATGIPCPLLVDRRCSVYEDRPITCRSFTSPDAALCHQAMANLEAGKGATAINVYMVLRFLCNGEQAATRGLCRDLGLQDDIVDLTQTVAAILRDPALIERWAAGERVFAAR